ncbi:MULTISPECIES: response regulator transcription factor [unclassified Corallococcus]|uniref:response regulator transcription factor n=1 Tax=unclassified Corallococcus TaxID=2685029 RepID=UPI001A8F8047|nr:response regulator [Corallococcus sp. NCRR]MBN9687364.1 response regulator transcription factor [Corallococcus sp. NCSPR001]WAS88814.1 response regulator [Corallococcus sp. NCRR]
MFVVDDDASVLRSLARMFQLEGYAVESFNHPRRLLERGPGPRPGCAVMDLRMPDLNGLELQEELRRAGWMHPIVFISGHGDVPAAVTAMKAGAVDFLPKPLSTAALLDAVERALAKDRAALSSEQEHQALKARFSALSPREWEVCRKVAQGLINKQIAAELGTAEQTVRQQRSRVMEKLKVDSVPELVRLLEQLGS